MTEHQTQSGQFEAFQGHQGHHRNGHHKGHTWLMPVLLVVLTALLTAILTTVGWGGVRLLATESRLSRLEVTQDFQRESLAELRAELRAGFDRLEKKLDGHADP